MAITKLHDDASQLRRRLEGPGKCQNQPIEIDSTSSAASSETGRGPVHRVALHDAGMNTRRLEELVRGMSMFDSSSNRYGAAHGALIQRTQYLQTSTISCRPSNKALCRIRLTKTAANSQRGSSVFVAGLVEEVRAVLITAPS